MDSEIRKLSKEVIREVFLALGFKKNGLLYRIFSPLFYSAADRLSAMALRADRLIETDGFPKAAEWMLSHWCSSISSFGEEFIPKTGPVLIISNHAGTYDTFILASRIGRNDLRLISSDVPFLKHLPNAKEHLIFLSENLHDRMLATREGVRHLQQGGSLLLYGTGLIDPDPQVYADAEQWIDKWSPSIDLFLRKTPDTRVVLSIASGLVSQYWANHPITYLKRIDWQKRRLAEFSQVLQQLFKPGVLFLNPAISFAPPVDIISLQKESTSDRVLPAIIVRGKELLADHCKRYM